MDIIRNTFESFNSLDVRVKIFLLITLVFVMIVSSSLSLMIKGKKGRKGGKVSKNDHGDDDDDDDSRYINQVNIRKRTPLYYRDIESNITSTSHLDNDIEIFNNTTMASDPTMLDSVAGRWADPNQMVAASYVSMKKTTPFPNTIPIPSMYPNPINPAIDHNVPSSKPEGVRAVGRPERVTGMFDKPIDAVMSQWTQWSACVNGMQERTRTCVVNGQNGGKTCGYVRERRNC